MHAEGGEVEGGRATPHDEDEEEDWQEAESYEDGDDADSLGGDEDFVDEHRGGRGAARGGRGSKRFRGSKLYTGANRVRYNDEFFDMDNGTRGICPQYDLTQDGVSPPGTLIDIPAWDLHMTVPADVVAGALQCYAILRAFSWQARLSPFPFEAMLAAILTDADSALRNEIHVCLLRTLAWHDSVAVRARRRLDLAQLNQYTWSDFMWEYVKLVGEKDLWTKHLVLRPWRRDRKVAPARDAPDGVARAAAVVAPLGAAADEHDDAAKGAVAGASAAGGAASSVKVEHGDAPMEECDGVKPEGDAKPVNGCAPPAEEDDEEEEEEEEEEDKDGAKRLRKTWREALRELHRAKPGPKQLYTREYVDLSLRERVDVLGLLCDMLLEQPTVRIEIERRANVGLCHAGKGGVGGAAPMRPAEERIAMRAVSSEDLNSDICMLCEIGGNLAACDTCAGSYHARCIGLKANPPGAWTCPECRQGGRGESAGIRVPFAGMLDGRVPLYLFQGAVLRAPHPGMKYVGYDEDMVDCGFEWLRGDAAWAVWKQARHKLGPDAPHPTAADALAEQCSSKALPPALRAPPAPAPLPPLVADASVPAPAAPPPAPAAEPTEFEERVPPPTCTPWTYNNVYRHAWPEACKVLQRSVDESKKLKRRGAPNVVVFAGMPMPTPFQFPTDIPRRHEHFLELAKREVLNARGQAARSLQLSGGELAVEQTEAHQAGRDLIPWEHPALKSPPGHLGLFKTLQTFLLWMENELWGVLDKGWSLRDGEGVAYRKRWCVGVMEATTAQQLADAMLDLNDAIRPCVAKKIFLTEWFATDVDAIPEPDMVPVPEVLPPLPTHASKAAPRAPAPGPDPRPAALADPMEHFAGGKSSLGFASHFWDSATGVPGTRNARAAAAQQAAAAGLPFPAIAYVPPPQKQQPPRANPNAPRLVVTGSVAAVKTELPPALHSKPDAAPPAAAAKAEDRRDAARGGDRVAAAERRKRRIGSNQRKRPYGKKVPKQPVPPGHADAGPPAPKVGNSAYIMNIVELRAIGKRPAPQFTNFAYFRTQMARVLPFERLPKATVLESGRQAGRRAVPGMVYPRLTTSSEAVARLAAARIKWKGLLQHCVSLAQLAVAFRHFVECLDLDVLERPKLRALPPPLRQARLVDRRLASNVEPEAAAQADAKLDGPVWQYLCYVPCPHDDEDEDDGPASVFDELPVAVAPAVRAAEPPVEVRVPAHGPPGLSVITPPAAALAVHTPVLVQAEDEPQAPVAAAAPAADCAAPMDVDGAAPPADAAPAPAPPPPARPAAPKSAHAAGNKVQSDLAAALRRLVETGAIPAQDPRTNQVARILKMLAPKATPVDAAGDGPVWWHGAEAHVATSWLAPPLATSLDHLRPGLKVWLSEDLLPVGFIKQNEETMRRHEAAQAARARAAAYGDTAPEAAPKAAAAKVDGDAAAAPSADACVVCGAAYAEKPELDDLWLACDNCDRWHHGECVGVDHEFVDSLGDDGAWTCKACPQRRRHRVVDPENIIDDVIDPESGKRRRRATSRKHYFDEDEDDPDVVAALNSTFSSDDEGAAPGGRRPRERARRMTEPEAPRAARGTPVLTAGVLSPEVEAAVAALGVHIPGFVFSSPSSRRAADGDEYTGGRRQSASHHGRRGPAVDWHKALLKAVKRLMVYPNAAPFCEPVPHDVPLYYDIVKNPMDVGTILYHLQSKTHYDSAAEVLADMDQVWTNCQLYNEAGSEIVEAMEDCRVRWQSFVAEALGGGGGARNGAAAGGYDADAGAAAPPGARGSPPQSGRKRKSAAAFDPPDAGAFSPAPEGKRRRAASTGAARSRAWTAAEADDEDPDFNLAGGRRESGGDRERTSKEVWAIAKRVHGRLMKHDAAYPFLDPVPEDVEGYYDVIHSPMDLGTIKKRLNRNAYGGLEDWLADVALVWSNCYTYNMEGSDIYELARQCEAEVKRLCAESGLS